MSHNIEIGRLGEEIACRFLVKQGFEVIDRNFLRKCGEIDIVAQKTSVIRFIEVKTVSAHLNKNVSHETRSLKAGDSYRAEDNVHPWKQQRMAKVIQTYLIDKSVSDETDWQFDVVTVLLDIENKVAKVDFLENIVL